MQQDSSAAQARLPASDLRRAEEARQAAEAEVAQLATSCHAAAADMVSEPSRHRAREAAAARRSSRQHATAARRSEAASEASAAAEHERALEHFCARARARARISRRAARLARAAAANCARSLDDARALAHRQRAAAGADGLRKTARGGGARARRRAARARRDSAAPPRASQRRRRRRRARARRPPRGQRCGRRRGTRRRRAPGPRVGDRPLARADAAARRRKLDAHSFGGRAGGASCEHARLDGGRLRVAMRTRGAARKRRTRALALDAPSPSTANGAPASLPSTSSSIADHVGAWRRSAAPPAQSIDDIKQPHRIQAARRVGNAAADDEDTACRELLRPLRPPCRRRRRDYSRARRRAFAAWARGGRVDHRHARAPSRSPSRTRPHTCGGRSQPAPRRRAGAGRTCRSAARGRAVLARRTRRCSRAAALRRRRGLRGGCGLAAAPAAPAAATARERRGGGGGECEQRPSRLGVPAPQRRLAAFGLAVACAAASTPPTCSCFHAGDEASSAARRRARRGPARRAPGRRAAQRRRRRGGAARAAATAAAARARARARRLVEPSAAAHRRLLSRLGRPVESSPRGRPRGRGRRPRGRLRRRRRRASALAGEHAGVRSAGADSSSSTRGSSWYPFETIVAQFWGPPCSRASRPPSRSRAGCRPPLATAARGPAVEGEGAARREAAAAAEGGREEAERTSGSTSSTRIEGSFFFALARMELAAWIREDHASSDLPKDRRLRAPTRGPKRARPLLAAPSSSPEQAAARRRSPSGSLEYSLPATRLRRGLLRRRTVDSTIDQLRALGARSPSSSLARRLAYSSAAKPTSTALARNPRRWPSFAHAVGGDGVEHLLLRLRITVERCFRVRRIDHPHDWDRACCAPRAAAPAPRPRPRRPRLCDAIGGIVRFLRERAPAAALNVCHVLPVSRDFVQRDEAGAVVDAGAAATVNARVAATNRQLDETPPA